MPDAYPVPARRRRLEENIRGSRFIATVARADSTREAEAFLQGLREEFPDATHHCHAWLIGPPGSTLEVSASDDGEPRGVAGRPMLHTLMHQSVGDLVAVVTRYFGGTKLGAPGLVRAYSGILARAMQGLATEQRVITAPVTLTIEYTHLDAVERLAADFGAHEAWTDYTDLVHRRYDAPRDALRDFQSAIREATSGRALFEES